MKLPKQVVLVGVIATAAPGTDADLHEVITAIVACLWCGVARGNCRTLGLSSVKRVAIDVGVTFG